MRSTVVLILACLALGCAASGPPRPSVNIESALFEGRHWNVAVLDLGYSEFQGRGFAAAAVYTSGGPDAGRVIGSLLANELSRLDNVTVVERGRIEGLVGERELQMSGVVSPASAVQIGEMLGANAVVVGDVTEYVNWTSIGIHGATVSFSMRMIDVQTGRVVLNGSISRVENYASPFQTAQIVTREMVEDIARR